MRKIPPAYRSVLSRGAREWCSAKMKMLTNATYANETSFISAWGYKVESKRARYRAQCDDKKKFWFFSTLPVSLAHTSRDSLRRLFFFFLSLITWNLREIYSTHRNAATATLVVDQSQPVMQMKLFFSLSAFIRLWFCLFTQNWYCLSSTTNSVLNNMYLSDDSIRSIRRSDEKFETKLEI